jgi:hypothetical protein
MSQRELVFVLAHAQLCTPCRGRLLASPQDVLAGRWLTAEEKEAVGRLKDTDFFTTERLAEVTGVSVSQLSESSNHPVVRLRHL